MGQIRRFGTRGNHHRPNTSQGTAPSRHVPEQYSQQSMYSFSQQSMYSYRMGANHDDTMSISDMTTDTMQLIHGGARNSDPKMYQPPQSYNTMIRTPDNDDDDDEEEEENSPNYHSPRKIFAGRPEASIGGDQVPDRHRREVFAGRPQASILGDQIPYRHRPAFVTDGQVPSVGEGRPSSNTGSVNDSPTTPTTATTTTNVLKRIKRWWKKRIASVLAYTKKKKVQRRQRTFVGRPMSAASDKARDGTSR